jgi:hypothetical protein
MPSAKPLNPTIVKAFVATMLDTGFGEMERLMDALERVYGMSYDRRLEYKAAAAGEVHRY